MIDTVSAIMKAQSNRQFFLVSKKAFVGEELFLYGKFITKYS